MIFPAERVVSQISSFKYVHVRIIKSCTWPNLSSPSSFRSSLVFFTHCCFCYFAENSTSRNSATSCFSISSSENNSLCNKEVILFLKESAIREVYYFVQLFFKKSLVPSQMQTLIIDFSETKFCQYLFGIDFIKYELNFAKLALSINASQICFLETFYFWLSIASIVRDLRRLVAIS